MFVRRVFLAALFGLLIAAAPSVRLPAGTPVKIVLTHGVSASVARVDDRVYLRVIETVQKDGAVIIPEGSSVEGRVSDVATGRLGRPGSVSIEAQYVIVEDRRLRLSGTVSAQGPDIRPGISQGVATVPFGALGKAKPVNLEAGTAFIAYIARDY